jgi:hypothetical protein
VTIRAIIASPIRAILGVGFAGGTSVLGALTLLDRAGAAIQDRDGLSIQTRV